VGPQLKTSSAAYDAGLRVLLAVTSLLCLWYCHAVGTIEYISCVIIGLLSELGQKQSVFQYTGTGSILYICYKLTSAHCVHKHVLVCCFNAYLNGSYGYGTSLRHVVAWHQLLRDVIRHCESKNGTLVETLYVK